MYSFHLYIPQAQRKSQNRCTVTMDDSPLSYTHDLDPKKIPFTKEDTITKVIVKSKKTKNKNQKTKNLFICSLNRSSQTMLTFANLKAIRHNEGVLSRFLTHANANISLPFHCPVQFSLSVVSSSL